MRGAASKRKKFPSPQVMMLACAVLALMLHLKFMLATAPISRDGHGRARGEGFHKRERWKEEAGWGGIDLADLEEWAPLGPDPPGCLPRSSDQPEEGPTVLVGWGFGSPQLTLYTYRALESILHVYPGARVRFITTGPRYARAYKWANIIARTQFQKYSKRGYDVEVEIYNGKMRPTKIKVDRGFIPGHKWWQREVKTLLYGQEMAMSAFQRVEEAVPDAHVILFLALLELYREGGIYVDLTTFFVRPLPVHLDGFVAGGQPLPGNMTGGEGGVGDKGPRGDCSTPTTGGRRQLPFVMQYREPEHPVVKCVLDEYDLEVSKLNECVVFSKDKHDGGMGCVLDALETCTEKVGSKNDLRLAGVVQWHGCSDDTARSYAHASSSGASGAETLEMLAAIPPQSSVSETTAGRARTSLPAAPGSFSAGAAGWSKSSRAAVGKGSQEEEAAGGGKSGRSGSSSELTGGGSGRLPIQRRHALNQEDGEEEKEKEKEEEEDKDADEVRHPSVKEEDRDVGADIVASAPAAAWGREPRLELVPSSTAESVSLLWMGSLASDGLWREPDEGSLWAEAFSRLRLTRWRPQQVSKSCRLPCGHWDTLSPEGSKAPENVKAQAAFQCAPSVFIPGTQKGASTFIFHAISWHPQIVQPLRGAHGFKETGRYLSDKYLGPDKLDLRLAAFPFVEEYENFASGDGTVTYMRKISTPGAILADSPHAKIVFALRDPVGRAWSDFRYVWGKYRQTDGFSSIVEDYILKTKGCFEKHLAEEPRTFNFGGGGPGQMTLPKEEEEAMGNFFSACSANKDGDLVRAGIYYYQVLHWIKIFGRDNVMVVNAADLKSRQKETIEEIFRFLGLCPADVSKLTPENVTKHPDIPESMKISPTSFKALQDFFEPFNNKLYTLLGRDLGWEKRTFTAQRRQR